MKADTKRRGFGLNFQTRQWCSFTDTLLLLFWPLLLSYFGWESNLLSFLERGWFSFFTYLFFPDFLHEMLPFSLLPLHFPILSQTRGYRRSCKSGMWFANLFIAKERNGDRVVKGGRERKWKRGQDCQLRQQTHTTIMNLEWNSLLLPLLRLPFNLNLASLLLREYFYLILFVEEGLDEIKSLTPSSSSPSSLPSFFFEWFSTEGISTLDSVCSCFSNNRSSISSCNNTSAFCPQNKDLCSLHFNEWKRDEGVRKPR